jgi:cytochrome P450
MDRTETTPLSGFSLAQPPEGFVDDPYPVYARLRATSPVHPLAPGSWLLTRHADVLAAYRHPALMSDKQAEFGPRLGVGTPIFEHHTTSLVFSDPPRHTRVRRLLMGALNQRAIARMEAPLARQVQQLLDDLAAQAAPDLIEPFAAQTAQQFRGSDVGVTL